MKTTIFLSLLTILFVTGCTEDITNESESIVEDSKIGIPNFESFKEFSKVGLALDTISPEDRITYEKEHNYVSMKSSFEKDWDEYQKLNSYEEFKKWKTAKSEKWKFDNNDFFTLPIQRCIDAGAINIEGQVIIANKLHNLKDPNDPFYNYVYINSNLKSSTKSFEAKNVGNRRVEAGIYYLEDVWGNGPGYKLVVRGYKKYLWKWNVYTTLLSFSTSYDIKKSGSYFGIIETIPSNAGETGFGYPILFEDDGIRGNSFSKERHCISFTWEKSLFRFDRKPSYYIWSRGIGFDNRFIICTP